MKYTAGELRAWYRGHRAYRLGKEYRCYSNNDDYIAAWKEGWFAAKKESTIKQQSQTKLDEKAP